MPLIGIDTYKIDFLVLETGDPRFIVLYDTSNYLSTPEKPLLEITPPGFTGHYELPYNVGGITVINSDNIGLTEECDYDDYAPLPDGVYIIKQKVCPYDELFEQKYYLVTNLFDSKFNELLTKIDSYDRADSSVVKATILDVEVLIKSAKAEIVYCNVQKGVNKYKTAMHLVEKLLNKVNCS